MHNYHVAVGYTHEGIRLTATYMPTAATREQARAKARALFHRTHTKEAQITSIRCLWRTNVPGPA